MMKRWRWMWFCCVLQAGFGGEGVTFQEQAARLQNINAFLLDFRPASPPDRPGQNQIELVLDLNPQPGINTKVGTKDEPVDPPSIVPKARARYLWSHGFMVGAALAPGVKFEGYEAEFLAIEAGYRFSKRGLNFSLRASFMDGDVIGPVTEPDLDDRFSFRNLGADLSVGKTFGAWSFYGFLGEDDTETSLEVELDGAYLENEASAFYMGAGVSVQMRRFRLTLEQNRTDDYLRHLIASVSYRL